MIGRAVFLKRAYGIDVFTVAKGKKGFAWLLEVALAPVLLAWMIEIVLHSLDSRLRLFPPALEVALVEAGSLRAAGAALLVIAIALFLAALIAFGKSWRVGIDERNPGRLVRGGVFALSRNPIFVSLDLYFLGTFLINGTFVFLLFAVLVAAGVHYQILLEERFLRMQYGPEYEAYCRTTGRYLGWANSPAVG
jgi:protein-S-isoprenylcysteine O-methyltransferase Ste14